MRKYTLLLLGSLFMFACGNSQSTAPAPAVKAEVTPAPAAKPAYEYKITSAAQRAQVKQEFPFDIELVGKDGQTVMSPEILDSGKPTVVLYWLTTCVPCLIEMKAIKGKYARWKETADFNLVAISTDFPKKAERIFPMAKEQGWPWEVYHDVNRKFRLVLPGELNGLPQSFIFDKNGEIVYHKRKYRPGDEDALFAKLQTL